jgi:RNA polymerase II subunit A small phosphatase-like protein
VQYVEASYRETEYMKQLLILDIDETLLHATEKELPHHHDFVAEQYFVYLRPCLNDFLNFAFDNFHVAIWTSSNERYAEYIARKIIPLGQQLTFRWSRDRCTAKFNHETWEYEYIKDLKKAKRKGFPLESIITIDNTPEKLRRNYGNLVRVTSFTGDQKDTELIDLMMYLEELKKADNVRNIEKRNWRSRL